MISLFKNSDIKTDKHDTHASYRQKHYNALNYRSRVCGNNFPKHTMSAVTLYTVSLLRSVVTYRTFSPIWWSGIMLENAIIMSRRAILMAVPFSWHSVPLKWQDESCRLLKFLFSVCGRGKRASLDPLQNSMIRARD